MFRAARSLIPSLALAASAFVALSTTSLPSSAYQRTLRYIPTGNGFGFQVYDVDQKKITEFLEHPYRYLKPRPGQLKADGIIRRNLAFDVYFGIKGGWLNGGSAVDPDYVDQSNIIHAPISLGGVNTESYFFAPFGYDGNAMIALLKADSSDGYIMLNFHLGAGESTPGSEGESIQAVAGVEGAVQETGPGGGAMVYVGLSGVDHADCGGAYNKIGGDFGDNTSCSGDDISLGMQKKLGSDGWWAVGLQYVENASDAAQAASALKTWAGARSPEQILTDAKTEFENWRKPPPQQIEMSENERKVWRQSESVLRMGQIREPYTDTRKNNGMILASLPHGEWHSGWVRDGIYAIVALARTGHAEETRMALDFLLNAAPVGNGKYKDWFDLQNYRISTVRYFGTGEEDADFSGQPTPNIEVDGWGMAMWAARQYVDASGNVDWLNSTTKLDPSKTVYQVLIEGVANPLESYLEPTGIVKRDSSIWEVHQGAARHFAFTTLAAARGFCDMAALAKRAGNDTDRDKYQALYKKVVGAFASYFQDGNKAFVGCGEGEGKTSARIDGSVVEVFTWNIATKYDADYVKPTFDLLSQLQVPSGGYKRNDEGQSNYDNHEWILIDLRMSDALRRYGDKARADQLLGYIVDKAAVNFYLVPELYSAVASDAPIGNYFGSIPMVGYGAGAYILTLYDRAGLIEPYDCGTKDPPITDGGAGSGGAGGAGQGGHGGGSQGGGNPGQGGGSSLGGEGGAGGCEDPLNCGNPSASTDTIPRKDACLCGLEESPSRSTPLLALGLLPLSAVARRHLRRRSRKAS